MSLLNTFEYFNILEVFMKYKIDITKTKKEVRVKKKI